MHFIKWQSITTAGARSKRPRNNSTYWLLCSKAKPFFFKDSLGQRHIHLSSFFLLSQVGLYQYKAVKILSLCFLPGFHHSWDDSGIPNMLLSASSCDTAVAGAVNATSFSLCSSLFADADFWYWRKAAQAKAVKPTHAPPMPKQEKSQERTEALQHTPNTSRLLLFQNYSSQYLLFTRQKRFKICLLVGCNRSI